METTASDILRNTKKINIALDTYLNERLASTDLTAAQGNVLFFILEHSGVHSTRIHKQLGISRGTVSGLIKKLREKGYVSFSSCDTDDRQKPILVTEKADALREALIGWQRELEEMVFRDFTPEERAALGRLQEKMLRNISPAIARVKKERDKEGPTHEVHFGAGQAV